MAASALRDEPQVLSSLSHKRFEATTTVPPKPRMACVTRSSNNDNVGLILSGEKGPATVLKVDESAAAYAAGVRIGDRIIAVNGQTVIQVSPFACTSLSLPRLSCLYPSVCYGELWLCRRLRLQALQRHQKEEDFVYL